MSPREPQSPPDPDDQADGSTAIMDVGGGASEASDGESGMEDVPSPHGSGRTSNSGSADKAEGSTALSGNASGEGPSLPVQKRRRVTRACDECRRKKIKCDGKQPCTHCSVYSYGIYAVPSAPAGHAANMQSRVYI